MMPRNASNDEEIIDTSSSNEESSGASGVSWENNHTESPTTPNSTHGSWSNDSIDDHQAEKRRTILFITLILLTGLIASVSFLYFTVASARSARQENFDGLAAEFEQEITHSFTDYEVAAKWIQESCNNKSFDRDEFRHLYEYVISGGLEILSAQFAIWVSHDERPAREEEMRLFLQEEYPSIEYNGFMGIGSSNSSNFLRPQSEQEKYCVVHYVEPLPENAWTIDLDIFEPELERETLEHAMTTKKPTLSNRFKAPGRHNSDTYSIALIHPGISFEPHRVGHRVGQKVEYSTGFSVVLFDMSALLIRAIDDVHEAFALYLYDSTHLTDQNLPAFLCGIEVHVSNDGVFTKIHKLLPEIELHELVGRETSIDKYISQLELASSTWDLVVMPVEEAHEKIPSVEIFGGVMVFVACAFLAVLMYNNMKRAERLNQIREKARAESDIVASLFPSVFRDRLIQDATNNAKRHKGVPIPLVTRPLKDDSGPVNQPPFLSSEFIFGSKPIADLFPEVTIMFADLEGFTAWSSTRDPTQVFTFLEVIYHSFDMIAKRRRVLKVETVGDCYVAVAGLPDSRKDHAEVMARFAKDCILKMHALTNSLEMTLGPDTADMNIRAGLHSGQVTAGVLRGDKGRFQLFGDTMNTASWMESTSRTNKIQASLETANLLKACGRSNWLTLREDRVRSKGKGEVSTYWVNIPTASIVTGNKTAKQECIQEQLGDISDLNNSSEAESKEKLQRLITWNVDVLSSILKLILARRDVKKSPAKGSKEPVYISEFSNRSGIPLDEVQDIVILPEFNANIVKNQKDPASILLDPEVVTEMTHFVSTVANMYRKNPFHNFEHASHVVLSVRKLLGRIVNPKEVEIRGEASNILETVAADCHDYTFGITSDPLTQFASVFSALIHDVDHPGVPNTTLVNEQTELATYFKNKSVAEQNSVELAWEMLMCDRYTKFRRCVFADQVELLRFRQLVVNMVMATDVMDKDLGALRKARWDRAFLESNSSSETPNESINRKATIVIEHLIQASDVSHTMQHWHVYMKWNERLFHEMYAAYQNGRLEKDPSEGWYEGEKGFLDFYVIPLAKKLDTCGVFGITSDEFLSYAVANRKEWDAKGKELVRMYKENHASYNT